MVMSLEVANAQYRMKPTNEVYNPYSAGSLASNAYAMPCGTTTAPTVRPVKFQYCTEICGVAQSLVVLVLRLEAESLGVTYQR